MNFSPISAFSIFWMFEMNIEALLVILAWKRRKQYPVFLIYIGFHLAWSVVMFPLAMSERFKLYFYSYWFGRSILFFLECAVIGVVLARILKPMTLISPRLTSATTFVGSLLCALGWLMSSTVSSQRVLPITRFVLAAERGLTTMEAVAILFCVALASIFAFRWTQTDVFLTAGFAFQALVTMISSALFSYSPRRFSGLIQNGLQVTDLIAFGLWIAALCPIPQYISQRRVCILSRSAR